MYVCVECRVEMLCDKNEVGAVFGHAHVYAHVYPSDRFKCPECGQMILATNACPIFDPEHKLHEEYLQMRDLARERRDREEPAPATANAGT